jgi:plasmid stabilization system protein ParE
MPSGRILRTPEALADLDSIWDYIARENPSAADRMPGKIRAAVHPASARHHHGLSGWDVVS